MGNYVAYPAYKDSGVEWLGDVPEHWEIRRLKFSVDLISNKVNVKDSELQFIGLENIESFTGKMITANSELESDGVALSYQTNDVLFCKLRPYLAKVYLAQSSGLCTSELLVLRGIEAIPNFLKYFLLSQEFINIVDSSTYGSKMPRANWEFIGNLACLIPGEGEQQQIADFLDEKTAHLDKLIEQKQQMIVLLNEKRMALITQAVTKGLDLTVPMKDSGVEWLGEIPEHWDSVALRWISKRYSGGTPDKTNDDYWYEGTIPWLNSGAVNQQVITKPSAYITVEAFKNSSAKWVPKDAVLIALAGQGKTKGMAAFTTFPTTCNQSMAAVVFERYDSKFMFWWLTSQYKNIRGLASDDARDGLNLEMIGSIPCPILDKNEQQQIANHLDTETQKIDTMITTVTQAVVTLQEYRTALITAAVTGKIDVRGFKLPKQTTLDDLAGCTRYHGSAKTLEDMDAAIEQGIIVEWGRHDSN